MRYRAIVLFLAVLACANVLSTQSASAIAAEKPKLAHQSGTSKRPAGDYFEARVRLPEGSWRSAQDVVNDLGKPLPFVLRARNDSVLIYCHAASLKDCDSKLLEKLKGDIATLSSDQEVKVIRLEHPSYVPDIVKEAQGLNYSGITVTSAGPDAIRVTCVLKCAKNPKYAEFTQALRRLLWRFQPQAPASRVHYLPASDAAKALSGGASADKGDKSKGFADGASATVTVQNLAASNAGPCPAGAKSDSLQAQEC